MPGPVIDAHIHPLVHERQREREPWLPPPESYLLDVAGLGVERAAALVIARRADPETTSLVNDAVLALPGQYDGFFFPVVSVHPLDGADALRELERVVGLGAHWLKLHPYTQGFDVAAPEVTALVRRAGELGVTVLFDAASPTDTAEPGKFVQLAMDARDTQIILAHAHAMAFPSLLVYEILARYPWWPRKVWVDISATAELLADGPYAEQFAWILRKVGVDRVLFGSDWVVCDPRRAVEAVRALGFDEAEQRSILHDNAAALMASH